MIFSYILYGFIWVLSFLPLRLLYVFSDAFFYILYYLVRYRRKVVRTNLQNSFPEKSIAEIIAIEKRYYRHMCDMFIELYKLWHMSEAEIRRRCVFKNTDILQHYYDQGKSVIGAIGHYGNWEWMSSYGLYMKHVDFYPLYKPIHDKVLDRMVILLRSHFGSKPVAKNDILRLIVKNRSEGKVFFAAFIADQTPNKANLNFWMNFLNQDTPVFTGTEKIARKFNIPVVSLRVQKLSRGHYEVDFMNLCEEPAKLAPGELTVMYTRVLEEQIRNKPEYWLWSHRRWKHKREEGQEEKEHNI